MADSSMASVVTDVPTEIISDHGSSHDQRSSPTPNERLDKSEPHWQVARVFGKSKPANSELGTFDCASLARNLSYTSAVPETPGVSRSSSLVSVAGHYRTQVGGSLRDAVPAIGTPSAIGALRLPKNPSTSLYSTIASPFKNPGSLRILNRAEAVQVSSVDFT